MKFDVDLSVEEAARLTARAETEGISIDALVRRVLTEVVAEESKTIPRLPEWPGRVIGSLRREDLYEDVR
jgi:hypothetical protein